jgi:hypothetical protein
MTALTIPPWIGPYVCSALIGDRCPHGFVTSYACNPTQPNPRTPPFCLREEWCGRIYEKLGGKPAPMMLVTPAGFKSVSTVKLGHYQPS